MEQPIQVLMRTTLENIKDMIDVNTVIGMPVETVNNTIIFPISKVGFGFVSGGGDIKIKNEDEINDDGENDFAQKAPFTGGSAAGVSVQPVGFLSVSDNLIRMIPVSNNTVVDRVFDLIPELLDSICKKVKKEG